MKKGWCLFIIAYCAGPFLGWFLLEESDRLVISASSQIVRGWSPYTSTYVIAGVANVAILFHWFLMKLAMFFCYLPLVVVLAFIEMIFWPLAFATLSVAIWLTRQ